MTISREFTEWAWALHPEAVPPEVRRRTAIHVLDGLGVALAAARLGAAPYAIPVAASLGTANESTVLGSSARASAAGAALANGLLMHCLDFDDTHTAGLVHATAVTLPAALAVGERDSVSGAQFLTAVVAGYELVGRISKAAPHGFHSKGFHATSVCGTFSSALVAALLSGLSVDEAVNALGVAGSQSAGNLEFLGSGASTKQIHPGWASLAGVIAADLAARGASGPETIFEGGHGLYALYSAVEPDLRSITDDLGSSWEALGIEAKQYPACHLMHRNLDVAQELREQVRLEDVCEIVVTVPQDSIPIIAAPDEFKKAPRSAYEAKFSVQWSVAAMLVDGVVNVDTYDSQRISRSDVGRVSQLVRYLPSTGNVPAAEAPGEISIRLADGSEVSLRSNALTSADGPTGEAGVLSKFRSNAGASTDATEELIDAVLDLPNAPHLSRVISALDAVALKWMVHS